jgi:hypothetical protein
VSDDAIHIQVTDAGPDRPSRRRPTTDGGGGLNIVDRPTGTLEFADAATDVRCTVAAMSA